MAKLAFKICKIYEWQKYFEILSFVCCTKSIQYVKLKFLGSVIRAVLFQY